MIVQNDVKHDEAHKRIRTDLRKIEEDLTEGFQALRMIQQKNTDRIAELAAAPVNAAKLVLDGKMAVAIVVTVLTIAGGVWTSTSGMRSDVRDIITRMDSQKAAMDAQKAATESIGKLQEVQSGQLREAVSDMKRRQELQQYEIQSLKEVILKGRQ